MQAHQRLLEAIPDLWVLEVIPRWGKGPFEHPIRLAKGKCITPSEPGASTDFSDRVVQNRRAPR
jgi:hypothetical protein